METVGQGRHAGSARGAVFERLTAAGSDSVELGSSDSGLEVLPVGYVGTALGDPGGLESAGGTDVGPVRGDAVDESLVGKPAGVGGGLRREELAGALEVFGEDDAEALADVLTCLGAVEGWDFGALDESPEAGEV